MISLFSVHDESTFKSGEVCPKRWFFGDDAPFHSKGKGKSSMVSDFLVEHPTGLFSRLSEKEYEQALAKYPDLHGDFSASSFLFRLKC